MLIHTIETDRTIGRPASEIKPLSRTAIKRLRNGDTVGTFCSTREGHWVKGRVIANDTRECILIVQHGYEPMDSYWYNEGDEIVLWPAD